MGMRHCVLAVLAPAFLAPGAGCGGDAASGPATGPVTVLVLVGGAPAPGVDVVFDDPRSLTDWPTSGHLQERLWYGEITFP